MKFTLKATLQQGRLVHETVDLSLMPIPLNKILKYVGGNKSATTSTQFASHQVQKPGDLRSLANTDSGYRRTFIFLGHRGYS
jgi:hypothetical protein